MENSNIKVETSNEPPPKRLPKLFIATFIIFAMLIFAVALTVLASGYIAAINPHSLPHVSGSTKWTAFIAANWSTGVGVLACLTVAFLSGAMGGLLYHMQSQSIDEKSYCLTHPRTVSRPNSNLPPTRALLVGYIGDILYGGVGGVLLLAISMKGTSFNLNELLGGDNVIASGEKILQTIIYLLSLSLLGGYLGIKLLRMIADSTLNTIRNKLEWQEQELVHQQANLNEQREDLKGQEEITSEIGKHLKATRFNTLIGRSSELISKGFYTEALNCLNEANDILPNTAKFYLHSGYCKMYLSDYANGNGKTSYLKEALKDFESGISIFSSDKRNDLIDETLDLVLLLYNKVCALNLTWLAENHSITQEDVREYIIGELNKCFEVASRQGNASSTRTAILKFIRNDVGKNPTKPAVNERPGAGSAVADTQKHDLENLYDPSYPEFVVYVDNLLGSKEEK